MTANLWGGRFETSSSELLRRFNDSFAFDVQLLAEDITGSIGWAKALGRAGVLTEVEVTALVEALQEIDPPSATDGFEDVHSFVEAKLRQQLGDLAGKLHTGRSRNDQVATDLKLWLKHACAELDELLVNLGRTLARRAEEEAATPMPGWAASFCAGR